MIVIPGLPHCGIFGHYGFRCEGAILYLHPLLLLLSKLHILLSASTVVVQSVKQILHVLIPAAFFVDLRLECALFLLFHFLKDTGRLKVNFLVALSQFLDGHVMLGPLARATVLD